MATFITHPVVAAGLSSWFGLSIKRHHVYIAMVLSVLPDIDVIWHKFGFPYDHMLGHRGLTHSLAVAALTSAIICCYLFRTVAFRSLILWVYFFLCMASHGVIDALTDGGKGVAFLAPFSADRYKFWFQPIEVSSLSPEKFFSGQELYVLKSEFIWVWLPVMILYMLGLYMRRRIKYQRPGIHS